jgi:hypothetical protein
MSKFLKLLAAAFIFTSTANADELLCASASKQQLYFSEGQLLVRAEINSPTLLSNLSMSLKNTNLGFTEEEAEGKASAKWVRFQGSDAWCDYTITLPKNFMTLERSVLFLDAHCEEGHQYTLKANCKVE